MADILASFRRYVEPYASGVTPYEVLFNTHEVLRDFCQRTKCWQSILAPIPSVSGQAEYQMTAPYGAVVCQVEEVWSGTADLLDFSGMDDLTTEFSESWLAAGTGAVERAYFIEPDKLRLHQMPSSSTTATLYVRAALMPDNATPLVGSTIPDFIPRNWATMIADGILSRLHYMPDKPYSSVNRADAKSQRYEQNVAAVRLKVAQSHGRKPLESKPQYY